MSKMENPSPKPSLRVLKKVADAEDVHPADLSPPLAAIVDPTALNHLFESTADDDSSRSGCVSFSYQGYEVVVSSDDTVELR
ncbi:HalOD1 output domain-containing protein [Natronoglomus mannanivorans]|uniref:Halobacterial output domain-containing protein n=1 Tax=Natronoglomus mannanivorans TaxID=2979990 RepID=A0AAP2Z5V0_9EURY|nr:hypothetical protein [Halobacteria archaeon AArc-xg1-1]